MPARRQAASVPPTVVAPSAPCTAHGQIARSDLPRLVSGQRESLQIRPSEAHADSTVDHADGGRDCARRAYTPFGLQRHLSTLGIGEPVRYERRLQSHHRGAVVKSRLDLFGEVDELGQGD